MEYGNTTTAARRTRYAPATDIDDDRENVRQRLETLLQTNAEIARGNSFFLSERERVDASLMKNPFSVEKSFSYLGLLLGTFPPAAFFTRFLIDSGISQSREIWILGVLAVVILISSVVGYFSGKVVGKIVSELEKTSWSKMLAALPFVGLLWGAIAGGAGGIIIFVFGAFFGAIVGGAVGAAALPFFSIFHRLLKRGDSIESKHFLPLAFATALIISAFFLGL